MKKNLLTLVLPAALAVFASAPAFALTRPDETKADKMEKANQADQKAAKKDAEAGK